MMTKEELAHGTVSSLFEICFKTSLRYLESSRLPKNEGLFLPEEVCQALISQTIKTGALNDDFIACFFADEKTSRMTKANLSCAAITDEGIKLVSRHKLRAVDVSKCGTLTEKSIYFLHQCKDYLVSLNIAHCRFIRSFSGVQHFTKLRNLDVSGTSIDQRGFDCLSSLVDLRRLNVGYTRISSLKPVERMLSLKFLDLSKCDKLESIKPLEDVKGTLCWLSLYNCKKLAADKTAVEETLKQLTQLQHLDLSRDDTDEPTWNYQLSVLEYMNILVNELFLEKLLPSLPNLTSLDISGNAKFRLEDLKLFHQHCKQKLHFLGLFQTDMCHFQEIPAERVTGNANLHQITLSMEIYKDRPKFLISALQELFSTIRERHPELDKTLICKLVLSTMENHSSEKKIQLAGSASLYHLSREDDDNPRWQLSTELKRRVIEATLNAMEHHTLEPQLQKNCCLTLCNFRIPDEVDCDYKRLVKLLLEAALMHREDFIQRIAIALCNLVVCQGQPSNKVMVGGDLQAVEKILKVMRYKMRNNPASGGVLECCWSALWNVTDETPENCKLFIANGGLSLFMECNRELGDQVNLIRNMLGLMGNVAEVPELRPYLMSEALIFHELLLYNSRDEFEVAYNAGGIISHLAFDGPSSWKNHFVEREEALKRLEETIEEWDIRHLRQMSYRSFAPILRLISGCDVPAIHHWATWALANLCNVDAEKYCKLVCDEGGMELLQDLTANPTTSQRVRELAQMTLDNCRSNLKHLECINAQPPALQKPDN